MFKFYNGDGQLFYYTNPKNISVGCYDYGYELDKNWESL